MATACCSNLLAPLLGELVGLLALDPERRRGKDEVALVETLSPRQSGVDYLGVDAADVGEDVGEVGAVEVERIELGVAVGVLFGDGVEAHAADLLRELLHGGREGTCAERREGGVVAMRDTSAECTEKIGSGGVVEGGDKSGTSSPAERFGRKKGGPKRREKARVCCRTGRHGGAARGIGVFGLPE
jgi:hypothetical protein